ncbi:MAG: 3-isopropylmalate dehydratase [Candidatus Odinarchaeota archaeon]
MVKGVNSVRGRAWRFGANISTDDIISGVYLTELEIKNLAPFVFENLRPEFAQKVQPGDVIVAGENFGMGSSREGAPAILRYLRVGAIVAASFARIFFRNAFNLGIPAIEFPELAKNPDLIREGDVLEINFKDGSLINQSTEKHYKVTKIPPFLLEYLNAGGAIPLLKQKMKSG